jgi:thiamine biosynthesis lipoprotein
MGTSYHITVVGDQADAQALQQRVDFRLKLINQQMSTYIDNSELSRFNRHPVDQWFSVSPELFEVLLASIELGWLSGGALDISVGPVVDLWGFGPAERGGQLPEADVLADALALVDFRALELDLAENRVLKTKPVQLDLSAIAKGFAVDMIARLLRDQGYQNFMVEIGGELYMAGNSPRGSPWRIAIEEPNALPGQVHRAILVSDKAVATSGDYRNYFEHDGKRYSHTIDPITGRPVIHNLASVTVIADDAAIADGLATAINVMGPKAGLALAQQQGLAIYLIVKTDQGFDSRYSDAFAPYLN